MTSLECKKINPFLFLIAASLIFLCLYSPDKMVEFAIKGLDLCGRSIIPSLFPFIVFSDMLINSRVFDNLPEFFGRTFEKLFKINRSAFGAFLIGMLCGFPLGLKYACDLYKRRSITKEECERLICFVNNTGPSFVIAGIGVAMRESVREGTAIYLLQIFSATVFGVILSLNKNYISAEKQQEHIYKDFSFSEAVKVSALNSIYICGFITFFSIISGFVGVISDNSILKCTFSIFLEIGNASLLCSRLDNTALSFAMTAAAVSFSGLSVHMQSKIFLNEVDISVKKYYLCKFLQGGFSFLLGFLIFKFIN